MSAISSAPTVRSSLASTVAATAFAVAVLAVPSYAQTMATADIAAKLPPASEDAAVRLFRINVPEAALVDLRQRVVATRWPDKETVTGSIAGRAAREDPGTRALLGDGLRLAESGIETECLAALRDYDRAAFRSLR